MTFLREPVRLHGYQRLDAAGQSSSAAVAWHQTSPSCLETEDLSPSVSFSLAGSTVVTEDLSSKLVVALLASSRITATVWPLRIREFVEFENTLRKIRAIEAVAGLLNDVDESRLAEFDRSVARRPLFADEQLSD